jgi:hypothetical protein
VSTSTLKAWTRDEIAREVPTSSARLHTRECNWGRLLLGLGSQVRLERYMRLLKVYIQ